MGEAADRLARLYRNQWEDYKKRFTSIEDAYMSAYDNEQMQGEQLSRNLNLVDTAFDTAEGIQGRTLSRYGTSPSADQKNAQNKERTLDRVATSTDIANRTRRGLAERDEQLLAGGITTRGFG